MDIKKNVSLVYIRTPGMGCDFPREGYEFAVLYRVILSLRKTKAVPNNGTPAVPFLVFVSVINTHRAVLGPAIWPLGLFTRKNSRVRLCGTAFVLRRERITLYKV